jgi:hypothetical protein
VNEYLSNIRRECFILFAKANPHIHLEDIAIGLGWPPSDAPLVADHFRPIVGVEGVKSPPVYTLPRVPAIPYNGNGVLPAQNLPPLLDGDHSDDTKTL